LIEIEVGEQGFTPAMNRADRQEAGDPPGGSTGGVSAQD